MILFDEPFESYRNSGAISFHSLLAYERSPLLYKKLYLDKSIHDERDSRALIVGSAAHALILEGDAAYEERFITRPDSYKTEKGEVKKWNGNADYCRMWVREQEGKGLGVLTIDEAEMIGKMALAVEECPELAAILGSPGKAEVVVRVPLPDSPLSLQCRFDWLTDDNKDMDLKTCLDLGRFKRDARDRRYHRQRAWYKMVAALGGVELAGSYLGAVEKAEPFRAKLFEIDETVLKKGAEENAETLEALAYSYEKDYWPGDHNGGGVEVLGVGDFYRAEALA